MGGIIKLSGTISRISPCGQAFDLSRAAICDRIEGRKGAICVKDYRLYLFDFDYTLANSEAGILKCFHLALSGAGYPDVPDDAIRKTIGLPMVDAVKAITGEGEQAARAFIEAYRPLADRYMTAGTRFYPRALETLRALKERGAKVAIISNKTGSRIQEKFDLDGAGDLVDLIIGSDAPIQPKPAPDGLLRAIGHFGTPKEAALYTGDSLVDARAAQRAGVDFAAVLTGATGREDFAPYPHVALLGAVEDLLTC